MGKQTEMTSADWMADWMVAWKVFATVVRLVAPKDKSSADYWADELDLM